MIRYDLRRLLPRSAIVALCLVCLGAFHSPVSAFVWPGTASGGTTTFGGTTVGAGNLGGTTFSNTPSGPVYATAGGKVYLPGGKVLDVTGKAPLSPAAYGKAIGRAASRLAPAAAVGAAIWDLLDDLGYIKDADGLKYRDPSVCSVAPCYLYRTSLNGPQGQWSTTREAACASAASAYNAQNSTYMVSSWSVTPTHCSGTIVQRSTGSFFTSVTQPFATQSTTPSEPQYLPATQQQLEDAIASQSGWPSGSSIGDAIREAIEQGETIPVPQPTEVTGPASAPGTSTTTQRTNRDASGNVTGVTNITTNTTYNFNYGPNTVTTTTVTTTTTTNPDGTTETSTDEQEDQEEPRNPCEDTPDLVTCGKLDSPETEVPKTTKNLTYAPEELGLGAGACPSPIPLNTSRGNWSLDLTPYCNATATYVRPMVILVAMFLAYLIMTGHRFGGD